MQPDSLRLCLDQGTRKRRQKLRVGGPLTIESAQEEMKVKDMSLILEEPKRYQVLKSLAMPHLGRPQTHPGSGV